MSQDEEQVYDLVNGLTNIHKQSLESLRTTILYGNQEIAVQLRRIADALEKNAESSKQG